MVFKRDDVEVAILVGIQGAALDAVQLSVRLVRRGETVPGVRQFPRAEGNGKHGPASL